MNFSLSKWLAQYDDEFIKATKDEKSRKDLLGKLYSQRIFAFVCFGIGGTILIFSAFSRNPDGQITSFFMYLIGAVAGLSSDLQIKMLRMKE